MKTNCTLSRIAIPMAIFAFSILCALSTNAQVQTIKPVYQRFASTIGGFYESLPVDYASQADKKYPLIIFMHGSGEKGDGSAAQLPRVLRNGLPKVISQGKFPTKFSVNGKEFSFIVVAPQISTDDGSSAYVKAMIEYCLKNYRVDEQRIYITGLSLGGLRTYNYLAYKKELTDKIAASLLVCPNVVSTESRAKTIASSNIPVWLTNNDGDPLAKLSNAIKTIDMINVYNPTPKAKITIFSNRATHDAWTQTYDPAFKENGMSVYEWMLTYTAPRSIVAAPVVVATPPVANAGADKIITLPLDSTELNGNGSVAGSTAIKTYQWFYISGPAIPAINNSSEKTTVVKNLVVGTHVFALKVTDNNGSSSSDSVTVIVKPEPKQTINPVYQRLNADLGGFYESLPFDYASQPTKKYPLIIFLHSSAYRGDGSASQLPKVLEIGLPKVINDGKFPIKFNVNGQEFSFIVMAPQVASGNSDAASIISMIEYCSKNYRIDEQRIYVTGIGLGGMRTYNYLAYKKELTDKIAASLLVCPNASSTESRAKTIASSNVPVWLTNNDQDPIAKPGNAVKTVDMINSYNPANKAKLTLFHQSGSDAWTKTYDPAFKEDGLNAYEWLLNYTTPRKTVVTVAARTASAIQENSMTETIASITAPNINSNDLNLSVKPNPVTSSMQVQIDGTSGNGFIRVYDLQGRMIQNKAFNKQSGATINVNMGVDRLQEGAYILQVVLNGNLTKTTRFVKL